MPDYAPHQQEIRALKQELADLFLEHHDLAFHQRGRIEAEYMMKIGSLEYKAFELQCKVQRLQRKIELISAAIKSRELIEMSQIDVRLVGEFSDRNERLSEFMGRMNAAMGRRFPGEPSNSASSAELRGLYAVLVKKLHPDLHPVQNEGTVQLFSRAVEAYKNAALGELRAIAAAVEDRKELMDAPVGSMDSLLNAKERLRDKIAALRETIGNIKSSYPYNQKALLEDEKRLRERAGALALRIGEYRRTCDALEKHLALLLAKSVWTR
jgi:hypothetical protein